MVLYFIDIVSSKLSFFSFLFQKLVKLFSMFLITDLLTQPSVKQKILQSMLLTSAKIMI